MGVYRRQQPSEVATLGNGERFLKVLNGLASLPTQFRYICRRDQQLDLLHATVVGVRLYERFLDQSVCIIDPPEFQ